MGSRALVVLLLAGAASAAPVPVAPAGSEGQLISDPGNALERSTWPASAPVTPDEAARAESEAAAARDLNPAPQPAPPPAPQPTPPPVERAELESALDAPGTGRLIEGRGGHDHVEGRGRGLIIDSGGRRLEILPVKNRLVETPPLPPPSGDLDGVLARLRLLTGAGAGLSLLLTAWLWRRKDA